MKFFPFKICIRAVGLTVFVAVIASAQIPVSNGPQPLASDEFLIHYGDVIDVDVVGGFDYDWRGTLTQDGFLDGFDAGGDPVFGLCRSESEIAADITRLLGRILREPRVVVRVLDRSSRAVVRLDGAVRNAARFQVRRPVHLRELIVMSGGIVDGASGEIRIFRPKDASCRPAIIPASDSAPGEPRTKDNLPGVTIIKISDLLSGKVSADPQILSGDLVTIVKALPIYVIGAVANPRPIYPREQMTLSRLIAAAGGPSKDGDETRVFIYRQSGADVRSIEADLIKIKKGETNDEVLQPFDIIEVGTKGGGKRKYPPVVGTEQNSNRLKQDLPLKIVD